MWKERISKIVGWVGYTIFVISLTLSLAYYGSNADFFNEEEYDKKKLHTVLDKCYEDEPHSIELIAWEVYRKGSVPLSAVKGWRNLKSSSVMAWDCLEEELPFFWK